MKSYLSGYLILISAIALFINGCTLPGYTRYKPIEHLKPELLFTHLGKVTYKASLSFHERNIDGLIMIKQTQKGIYRISWFNQIGMQFMNAEFVPSGDNRMEMQIDYVNAYFNYKPLLKFLEKDFSMLFSPALRNQNSAIEYYRNDSTFIQRVKSYSAMDHYAYCLKTGELNEVRNVKKISGKQLADIKISNLVGKNYPDSIHIKRKSGNYTLTLTAIE